MNTITLNEWMQDAREEIKTVWDTEFLKKESAPQKEAPVVDGTVIRACAWCWPGDTLHKSNILPDLPVSHGICPTCMKAQFGM